MVRRITVAAVTWVSVAAIVWGADPKPTKSPPAPSKADRSFGTTIQWENTMEAAAKKADRYGKLIMVLAVAGHFEDPFFT